MTEAMRTVVAAMGAIMAIAAGAGGESVWSEVPVHCGAPAGLVEAGTQAFLQVKANADADARNWFLLDWQDKKVASGECSAGKRIELGILPVGHYRLTMCGDGVSNTTSLCVLEPLGRKLPANSPYAIMTAIPCVVDNSYGKLPWGDPYALTVRQLDGLGFSNVREIIKWEEIEPARDCWKGYAGKWKKAFDLLAGHGVSVNPFIESAPDWTRDGDFLPRDLMALYRFCERLAREQKREMSVFEFWNEQDAAIRSQHGAWEYAAAAKAAALGIKAGNRDCAFIPGAVALGPDCPYCSSCYASDLLDYCDAVNFHCYVPVKDIPGSVDGIRRLLGRLGKDRAIWLTEFNTNQEGLGEAKSLRKGCLSHSWAQERIVAELVVKSQIAVGMEGVDRNYYFILPCLNERSGAKEWGLTHRDGTVKLAYAVLATFIREVGEAKLLGLLFDDGKIRSYLYEFPDGTQTLVCWAVSQVEKRGNDLKSVPEVSGEYSLPAEGRYVCVDACGAKRPISGSLAVNRFPQYVRGLKGLSPIRRARPPEPFGAPPAGADEDRTIVLQPVLDNPTSNVGNCRSELEFTGQPLGMTIDVWNFEGRPKKGSVFVRGATGLDVPGEVEVPAFGKVSLHARLAVDGAQGEIVIGGCFDGKKTSRAVLPYRNYAKMLNGLDGVELAEFSDPSKWVRNAGADVYRVDYDETEKAVRFDCQWKRGRDRHGHWLYPYVKLNPSVAADVKDWEIVEFEIKATSDKMENDYLHCGLYFGLSDATLKYMTLQPPTGVWEKRYVIVPESIRTLSGRSVVDLRLGCGPVADKVTCWVRNVKIHKRKRQRND